MVTPAPEGAKQSMSRGHVEHLGIQGTMHVSTLKFHPVSSCVIPRSHLKNTKQYFTQQALLKKTSLNDKDRKHHRRNWHEKRNVRYTILYFFKISSFYFHLSTCHIITEDRNGGDYSLTQM